MKHLIFLMVVLGVSNCQLSPPKGQLVLNEITREGNKRNTGFPIRGESTFVKLRMHPQVRGGDIYGGYWVLLQIDNEAVNFKKLFERVQDKSTPSLEDKKNTD